MADRPLSGHYGRWCLIAELKLGGPKIHPVDALELDVGQGFALRFLWLATDGGTLWDPGKGYHEAVSRDLVCERPLWSLSKAEIYVVRYGGQRSLEDFA